MTYTVRIAQTDGMLRTEKVQANSEQGAVDKVEIFTGEYVSHAHADVTLSRNGVQSHGPSTLDGGIRWWVASLSAEDAKEAREAWFYIQKDEQDYYDWLYAITEALHIEACAYQGGAGQFFRGPAWYKVYGHKVLIRQIFGYDC